MTSEAGMWHITFHNFSSRMVKFITISCFQTLRNFQLASYCKIGKLISTQLRKYSSYPDR